MWPWPKFLTSVHSECVNLLYFEPLLNKHTRLRHRPEALEARCALEQCKPPDAPEPKEPKGKDLASLLTSCPCCFMRGVNPENVRELVSCAGWMRKEGSFKLDGAGNKMVEERKKERIRVFQKPGARESFASEAIKLASCLVEAGCPEIREETTRWMNKADTLQLLDAMQPFLEWGEASKTASDFVSSMKSHALFTSAVADALMRDENTEQESGSWASLGDQIRVSGVAGNRSLSLSMRILRLELGAFSTWRSEMSIALAKAEREARNERIGKLLEKNRRLLAQEYFDARRDDCGIITNAEGKLLARP